MINSKRFLKVWAVISIAVLAVFANVEINEDNFPDPIFREYLTRIETNRGISMSDLDELYLYSEFGENLRLFDIQSLQGIELLKGLRKTRISLPKITSLDLSGMDSLRDVNIHACSSLVLINLSNNPNLLYVIATVNEALDSINLSGSPSLVAAVIATNRRLRSIDVSESTELQELSVFYNRLYSLDVSKNTELKKLEVYYNNLTSLDVSKNTALKSLITHDNFLTSLDLSQNDELEVFTCFNNIIPVANLPPNQINSNTDPVSTSLWHTLPQNGKELTLEKEFPDEKFRAVISRIFSATEVVSYGEISKRESLMLQDEGIEDLSGIEYFASLVFLDVSNSQPAIREVLNRNRITELDLSRNIKLQELNVSNNELKELDLSKNIELVKLDASENDLREIDLSFNRKLEELNLSRNRLLTTIDLSENEKLEILDLSGSGITAREAITGLDKTKVDVENLNLPTSTGRPSARKISSFAFAGVGNGQINLRLQAGNYTVELYNLQGRKIRSVNINAINGINATGLKVDGLSSGIFVLNVKQHGALVLRHKLTLK